MDRKRRSYDGNKCKPQLSGCLAVPAAALTVAFEPIQSGTGDPSPTNIRPISGRTETSVKSDGKNIISGVENGVWNTYGIKDTSDIRLRSTEIIPVTAASYVVSATAQNILYLAQYRDSDNTTISESGWLALGTSISIPQGCVGVSLLFRNSSSTTIMPSDISNIQMEVGTQATPYVPYKAPSSILIQFGQTVYGGNLDVKTGVLTITHGFASFNGNETWYESQSVSNAYYVAKPADMGGDYSTTICNSYKGYSNLAPVDYGFGIGSYITLKDIIHATSLNDWKTYLASNNVQVCYELATPTTVQLTPAQLEMLKGYNSLSTDGGDVITITAYVKTT